MGRFGSCMIDNQLSFFKETSKIRFRGKNRKWRMPWIVGLLCYLIYQIGQIDFYHFYLYFFCAGVATMGLDRVGWIIVEKDRIQFRLGLLRFFSLSWHEIDKIETGTVSDRFYVRFGAVGAIRTDNFIETPYLGIRLKEILLEDRKETIKKFERSLLFGQSIDLKEDGRLMRIFHTPEDVKSSLAQYLEFNDVEQIGGINNSFFSRFDFILLLISAIVFLLFI